jgi:hypothetical protein
MDTKQAIISSWTQSDFFWQAYLADLTDKELLARPCPAGNHIAWQLGHLIQTEQHLVDKAAPGKVEPLPADFKARHKKDTASSDDAGKFLTKDEYIRLAKQVRADAMNALEGLPTADLAKPVTGVPPFCKTVGDTFMFLGAHWLMHAGQWAVIRRSLGKPPLF